jgi:hypothetical protein
MKPLLFVDVDGVLNVIHRQIATDVIKDEEDTGLVAFCPVGSRERLTALLEVFDPVWATSWDDSAHRVFRQHLGLGDKSWPVLRWKTLSMEPDLKIPEIVRFAVGRPWAWLDDDVEAELRHLPRNFLSGQTCAPIQTSELTGLDDVAAGRALMFASILQRGVM